MKYLFFTTLFTAMLSLGIAHPTHAADADISSANAQELRQLAKSYKGYLAQYDTDLQTLKTNYGKVVSENDMLNQEYSQLRTDFDTYKEQSEQKSLYIIIAGLIIGGIAILAK